MQLELCIIPNEGFILFSELFFCFIIDLYLGFKNYKVSVLLDSGVSACFLDEQFVKSRKIPFVQKPKPVHVKVIDGRLLSSGDVTHETHPIKVTIDNHDNYIAINIIKSPSNPVILSLSWLKKYNPRID
ncbi:hypothetical protein GCM10010495_81840 [Kitasatospora herbaricolor]|nr:hypothetical protein GCM10010495_81840 [Kitasatospora herbaricolor]